MTQDPRSRRRAETHRRIYLAAMDLFLDRGFDEVSVGEIAAAAGISVPTFYAHFPSKEHVVLPVPERTAIQALLASLPPSDSVFLTVRDAMLRWLESYRETALEELLQRWQVVVSTPGLRLRAAEFERFTATMVLESLPPATVVPARKLATELVVTALFSSYTQILLRWAEEDGARSLLAVADEVLTTLRNMGGPVS